MQAARARNVCCPLRRSAAGAVRHGGVRRCHGRLPYLSGKEASLAEETLAEALESVHAAQHALLVANAPGCRASLQLGGALSRIAGSWVGGDGAHSDHANAEAAQRAALVLKRGGDRHGAVALGALCALLELPQQMVIDAFIYTQRATCFRLPSA